MESDDLRETLRAADRAEAAPWVDYPPTPRWYPVAVGIWGALVTLALTRLDDLRLPAVLGLIALEAGFLGWYVRYRQGVMPTGRPPREFRRSVAGFVAGAAVAILGAAALAAVTSDWVAAGYVLVVVTAVIAWYERAYAAAARRTRERLG